MVKRYGFLIIVFVFLLSIVSSCYAQTPSSSVRVEVKPRIKYCDNSCDTYKYLLVGRFGSNSDNDVLSFADHAYMRFKVVNGNLLVDLKDSDDDFRADNGQGHLFCFCCDENGNCNGICPSYCLCDFLEEPVRLCYQDDWISFDELKSALTGRSVFKNFVFYFSLLSKDITNYDETSDDPSLDYTEGGWCNKGGQGECKNKFSEGDSFVFERGDSNVGYKFKSHYLSDEEDVLRNYIKLEHGHIYDARANPFIYKKMNDYTEDLDIGPHPTLVFEISPDKDFAKHVGYKWYDEEWKAYTFEKFNLCTNEEKVLYLAYKPESEKGLKKSYIHLRVKNNGEKTILIYLNKSKSYAIYACIDSDENGKCDSEQPESDFSCDPINDGVDDDGDGLTDCEDPDCCSEEVCREICAQRECGEEGGVWNSEIGECCGDEVPTGTTRRYPLQDFGLIIEKFLCIADVSGEYPFSFSNWNWIAAERQENGKIIDFEKPVNGSFASNGENWYVCNGLNIEASEYDGNVIDNGNTLPLPEGGFSGGCPNEFVYQDETITIKYTLVNPDETVFKNCKYSYEGNTYYPCHCIESPESNFCHAVEEKIDENTLTILCGGGQYPGQGQGQTQGSVVYYPYDLCSGLRVIDCFEENVQETCEDYWGGNGHICSEGTYCADDNKVVINGEICCPIECQETLSCGDEGTFTCSGDEYCPEEYKLNGGECCRVPCITPIEIRNPSQRILCFQKGRSQIGQFGECCEVGCINDILLTKHTFTRGYTTSTIMGFDEESGGNINLNLIKFTQIPYTIVIGPVNAERLSFFIAAENVSAINVSLYNDEYLIGSWRLSEIVAVPTPKRWHKAIIELNSAERINKISFESSVEQEIIIDNIEGRIVSPEMYCSGGYGIWLTDLDPYGEIDKSIFAYACNGFAAYGWTGNYCCGDDGVETYNDTIAGCYEGMIVPNNWRVGDAVNNISLNKILFFNHSFKVCGPSINDWENYSQYSILGRYYCGEDNKWYLLEDMPVVSVIGSTILQQLEQPYYLLCDNFSRIVVADHSKVGDDLLNAFDYGCIGRDDSKVIIGLHRIDKSYNYSTIFKFFYPYLDADEIDEDVLNAPLIVTNEDFYISNSISLSSNSNNLYINYLYNKPIDIMIFSVERDSRNFISRFFSGFIGFFRHLFGGDIEEYAGSGEISFIPNYYYTINNTDWYNAWKGEEGVFVNSSIPQGYLIDIGCENTENNFYQCPMDKWIIVSSKRNI